MSIFTHLKEWFASFARPYPARDWFLAIIAGFFAFFAFASYGLYLYVEIQSGAAFESGNENSAPAVSVTNDEISAVTAAYRVRLTNWSAHNLPAPAVSDPH